MRRLLLSVAVVSAIAAAAVFMPAHGAEVSDNTIALSSEEMALCVEEGGCQVVTASRFKEVVDALVEKRVKEALAARLDCPGERTL